MFKQLTFGFILLLIGFGEFAMAQSKHAQPSTAKIFLRERWSLQSSAQVKEKGDVLSQRVFQPRNWDPARVPSTVAGTLVENKVYPDPFTGMMLRIMPGCIYPIGANFSLGPMPLDTSSRISCGCRTE